MERGLWAGPEVRLMFSHQAIKASHNRVDFLRKIESPLSMELFLGKSGHLRLKRTKFSTRPRISET
jgi:hypothetical protein